MAGYLSIPKPTDVEVKIEEENIEIPEIPSQIEVKPLSEESNKIVANTTIDINIKPKATPEQINNISVSFIVLDKKYELEINENSSVFEVMKKLQDEKENEFSFNYKEYPGMGAFVNEINGMKGKSGAYWIYYVNEKEASVGVSSYILKEGDSILWKQE